MVASHQTVSADRVILSSVKKSATKLIFIHLTVVVVSARELSGLVSTGKSHMREAAICRMILAAE